MKILFRADSSSKIGLGHIMRDMVLASQFKGDEIIFACQDLEGHIMEKIPYPIMILDSDDIDELIMIVKKKQIEMLVIDHYGISWEDEKRIKEMTGVKILAFDDTYERHHCDILLNHNIYADKSLYHDRVPSGCELRCGGDYTLIRKEFVKEKRNKIVFVAMGGVDSDNVNVAILEVLQKFSYLKAIVVTTSANKHLKALQTYVAEKSWIDLHIDSDRIAFLMKQSDFAIVTPSVMLHEVIFMELPFIAIQTAENQREMVKYLHKYHDRVLESFDAKLLYQYIKSIRIKLIDFIDLSPLESEMVLAWRNDETIRRWMVDKAQIPLEKHLDFVESLALSEDKRYYLVLYHDAPIGVIDFVNIQKESIEFGLYAKPRTMGYGDILMETVLSYAFESLRVKKLYARLYHDNDKAKRLYQKYGFVECRKEKEMVMMELYNENSQL